MRRVHVSRTRSRSRSRSPLLRGPRPVVSKSQPVNMLDQAALLAVRISGKKESKPFTPKERITCTIDGPRRSGTISSRISGFGDRRRSDGDRMGGFQNRQTMRDRLSFADRQGRDRFEASRERDLDSNRFNGKFRDEDADKPVQRLIDPTAVPKGKSYFGHDDRGEEKQWRGRSAYDPRIDMGPRSDRLSGFRGYGRDRFSFISPSSMNAEIVIVVPEGRSLLDQLPMVCGLTTNSLNWREMRIKMASLEDHTAVVAMHKRESSVSEISKTLKLHREQVDPDINRFGEAGRIENRPRGRSDRTARTPAL
ncbi:hypothetical protein Y032_0045g1259 [Ancylostoma ceylanicum]|uniref:Uncharacterized protein n=1 Tax=Ancylostoma ceylanicum TaxID=53326 RepID=A0A016UCR2_9BILA|nr:hypothetical protein Y032_0045g1259 [Ancylostoma ceylanicum]